MEKIVEYIENGNQTALNRYLQANVDKIELSKDFIFLINGMKAMKLEKFQELISQYDNDEMENILDKANKMEKIESLTLHLKSLEKRKNVIEKKNKKTTVISLLRKYSKIAAVFIVVLFSSVWFLNQSNNSIESMILHGPDLSMRSEAISDNYIQDVNDKDWSAVLAYSKTVENPSLELEFYTGVALFNIESYEEASKKFEIVVENELPLFLEDAIFNKMIIDYILGKDIYKRSLEMLSNDPNYVNYKEVLEFKKMVD